MSIEAVAHALATVRERIASAERSASRPAGAVTLVAVSKRQPPEAIRAAYAAGQRDFGENYVQELVDKAGALADLTGIRFHFIGNIQSNKARQVAGFAHVAHTIDDAHLARELGRRAAAAGRTLPVLVQVNIAAEAQKHGCAPADLAELLEAIEREPALRLSGLMTIPPAGDADAARRVFSGLRTLRALHGGDARLPQLSMGMSDDLDLAVAEGATIVRVGTAIFGPRLLATR